MYTPTFARLFVYLSVLALAASASAKPTRITKNRLAGSVAKRAVQSGNPLKQLTIKRASSHRLVKRVAPSPLANNLVVAQGTDPSTNIATGDNHALTDVVSGILPAIPLIGGTSLGAVPDISLDAVPLPAALVAAASTGVNTVNVAGALTASNNGLGGGTLPGTALNTLPDAASGVPALLTTVTSTGSNAVNMAGTLAATSNAPGTPFNSGLAGVTSPGTIPDASTLPPHVDVSGVSLAAAISSTGSNAASALPNTSGVNSDAPVNFGLAPITGGIPGVTSTPVTPVGDVAVAAIASNGGNTAIAPTLPSTSGATSDTPINLAPIAGGTSSDATATPPALPGGGVSNAVTTSSTGSNAASAPTLPITSGPNAGALINLGLDSITDGTSPSAILNPPALPVGVGPGVSASTGSNTANAPTLPIASDANSGILTNLAGGPSLLSVPVAINTSPDVLAVLASSTGGNPGVTPNAAGAPSSDTSTISTAGGVVGLPGASTPGVTVPLASGGVAGPDLTTLTTGIISTLGSAAQMNTLSGSGTASIVSTTQQGRCFF